MDGRRCRLAGSLCLGFLALGSLLGAEEAEDRESLLLFNTGSRLYRQKNWRDAAATFGEFLKKFPRHRDAAEARFAAGYSLHRVGDHGAAAELLRLASRDEAAAWAAEAAFYLGRSLEALGAAAKEPAERTSRLTDAAEAFGRAARLYARPPDARKSGDRDKDRDKDREKGKEGADAALDSARKNRDLRILAIASQGEALYQAGKHAEAEAALDPLVVEKGGQEESSHFQRGVYVLGLARQAQARAAEPRAGRFQSARAALALASAPRHEKEALWEEAEFLLARLAHEDGDLEPAIEAYGRVARKMGSRAAEASYHRALALYETEKPDLVGRAREELAAFLDRNSSHALAPRARFQEALCAFDLKDYAAAEAALARVAEESPDLAGRALLRRGQALLSKDPRDPSAAAEALAKAHDALSGGGDPARAAEALYWKAEALAAVGGDALAEGAAAFGEVHSRYRAAAADLAERGLYQKARILHLARKHAECARASDEYRKAYPEASGRFRGESLLLSAESAFQAEPGTVPEALRRDAPRFYEEAAASLADPLEAARARYMNGVALYSLKEYRKAAERLDEIRRGGEAAGASRFPELHFFLADSLAQEGGSGGVNAPAATEDARERWRTAIARYREYLATSREGAHAPNSLINMALCQEWLEEHDEARKTLETFLERFPGHALAASVRFELGNVRLALGDLEGSASAYASAADAGERSAPGGDPLLPARALYQKGLIERRLGQPEKTAETMSVLIERHADALKATEAGASLGRDARYQRASALLDAGKAGEGRTELAAYIEKEPGSPHDGDARNQLARSLLDSGKPVEALAVLEPLARGEASRAGRDQALYLEAWCRWELARGSGRAAEGGEEATVPKDDASPPLDSKHVEEMETAYRKLIAEHPKSPLAVDAMLELGQHLFNRKAYAEARKWLESAREAAGTAAGPPAPGGAAASPATGERAALGLGFIAYQEKRLADAAKLFDAVASNPASPLAPRALFQAGRALLDSGLAEDAAERFRKVADEMKDGAGPLHEESLLRLAECLHQLRKYDDSLRAADRLLAEYPEGELRHEGRFARGFALQFSGNLEGAIEAYRGVVVGTRAPVAARAQYHIGECRVEQGKHREAAREFTSAVANFDFEGEYAEWVRRALLAAGLAYHADGDMGAAAAQFRELVERFPSSEEGKAAAERMRETGKRS